MNYYTLSIGSNINPKENSVRILKRVCEIFGAVLIYPFALTDPENFNSQHDFLNTIIIIKSNVNTSELKATMVEIEESLGRNKDDPLSAIKDRTADIDIIAENPTMASAICVSFSENYLNTVLEMKDPVSLAGEGLPAIVEPTILTFDTSHNKFQVVRARPMDF